MGDGQRAALQMPPRKVAGDGRNCKFRPGKASAGRAGGIANAALQRAQGNKDIET